MVETAVERETDGRSFDSPERRRRPWTRRCRDRIRDVRDASIRILWRAIKEMLWQLSRPGRASGARRAGWRPRGQVPVAPRPAYSRLAPGAGFGRRGDDRDGVILAVVIRIPGMLPNFFLT